LTTYGRLDEIRHRQDNPAALGGVKADRTMRFLLDHAAGLQPPPDETLREACVVLDRYALHDGFDMPYGRAADDSYRAWLLELAARLRAFPLTQRYSFLSDVEQALAAQTQAPPAPPRPWRSRWRRRAD
jgi:hypothetical protein